MMKLALIIIPMLGRIAYSLEAAFKLAIKARVGSGLQIFQGQEDAHLKNIRKDEFDCFVERGFEKSCNYYQDMDKKKTANYNYDYKKEIFTITGNSKSIVIKGGNFETLNGDNLKSNVQSIESMKIISCTDLKNITKNFFKEFTQLKTLSIMDTSMEAIPSFEIDSNLEYFAMINSKLKRINDYDFSRMRKLKAINVACNDLTFISDLSFVGLSSVQKITLGGNYLTEMPTALKSISKSVKYVGLEYNSIQTLAKRPLQGMESLVHLNMTGNMITHIDFGWYDGTPILGFIELGRNHIPSLEPHTFSNLSKLVYISVAYNLVPMTVKGKSVFNLPKLRMFEAFDSNIYEIDYRTFDELPLITFLNVAGNKLSYFPHFALNTTFEKLRYLWLDRNQITTIEVTGGQQFNERSDIILDKTNNVTVFTFLKLLEYIDLGNNRLEKIPNGILDCFKQVKGSLYLENNQIKTIEEDAFKDMKFKDLRLRNNLLSKFPKAMFEIKSVNVLDLSSNTITYLRKGSLSKLDMCTILYLHSNKILAIENGAFPLGLQELYLDNNYFEFLDEDQFNNMNDLTILSLRNNRITYLPINAFMNNSKLSNILLSGNKISSLKRGMFDGVSDTLTLLDISKNNLYHVEHGVLQNKTINDLIVSKNMLNDWPMDKSLSNQKASFYADFSENKFEVVRTGMFENLDVLKKVMLAHNLISDVQEKSFHNIQINLDSTAYVSDMELGVNLLNNPIYNLEPKSFKSITCPKKSGGKSQKHTTLNLQEIQTLDTIRSRTFEDVTIDYIMLNNGGITTLEQRAFNNIKLHWTLQINDGPLKYIGKNAVNATWIQFIQFNNNTIKKLPKGALGEIASCTNINIKNNDINFIDTGSLPNCTEKFSFNQNKVTRIIEDAFSTVHSLTRLVIPENALEKIDANAFDSFSSKLQKIEMDFNRLTEIPDGVLDGVTLELLKLDNNPNLQTIGRQNNFKFSTGILALTPNKNIYVHKSMYSSATKVVPVYKTSECTCNLLDTMQIMKSKNKLSLKGTAGACKVILETGEFTLKYSDVINGNGLVDSEDKFNCEPYTHSVVRKATEFEDEVAVKENIIIKFQLPETIKWKGSQKYCSKALTTGCQNYIRVIISCFKGTNSTEDHAIISNHEDTIDKLKEYDKDHVFEVPINADAYDGILSCSASFKNLDISAAGPVRTGFKDDVRRSEPITCNDETFNFEATFYDLDDTFIDFENMGKDRIFKRPLIYYSPSLGAYLYKSDKLDKDDTLTQWFTPNANVGHIQQKDFCLKECQDFSDADTSYCFFARSWWPVDDLVDIPTDTTSSFVRHNMYFTVRLQISIKFSGTEVLTIGGPDDIWVYFGEHLVLEVLAVEDDDAALHCGEIRFSNKGKSLVTNSGILNMGKELDYSNKCNNWKEVENLIEPEKVLTRNDLLEVRIFTTQRRSLSSQLFVRVLGFKTAQNTDHNMFSMSERKTRGGKVGELNLKTVLPGKPEYKVTIERGNDNFEIKNSDYTVVDDPEAEIANVFPGKNLPDYYNCDKDDTNIDKMSLVEVVTMATDIAFVILINPIDFEAMKKIKYKYLYLKFEYEYQNNKFFYTKLRIRIDVTDYNDNCPHFSDPADTTIDRSKFGLMLKGDMINATDADSFNNSRIQYFYGK